MHKCIKIYHVHHLYDTTTAYTAQPQSGTTHKDMDVDLIQLTKYLQTRKSLLNRWYLKQTSNTAFSLLTKWLPERSSVN